MSHLPQVALIGRPNVGKSTLYNRLIGKRQAVVADVAGTTRDRLQSIVAWEGKQFILTDMAGLELSLEKDTEISQAAQAQVERALQEADLLLWVVDGLGEVGSIEQKIAVLLQSLHKPIIIAINKCDHQKHDDSQYDFMRFPSEAVVTLSAIHGRGINELLDAILPLLPTSQLLPEVDQQELRLSIVGRPNVGKSTLLNALVKEERSVVSKEAGTTRDSVDTVIPALELFGRTFTQWKTVRIIDTAGIRRRGKVGLSVESWSVVRTLDAVDASQVVLFMIDASEGLVHQDLQVAQQVIEAGRAMILVLNKWDLVLQEKHIIEGSEAEEALQEAYLTTLRRQAPFLHWIQVVFLSAKEQLNLHYLGRLVQKAYQAWSFNVSEEELNQLTLELRKTPRLKNLQRIRLEHSQPPVFHLEVEGQNLPHFSTVRYVENVLRDYFEIGPSLIKIWCVPSLKRRHK